LRDAGRVVEWAGAPGPARIHRPRGSGADKIRRGIGIARSLPASSIISARRRAGEEGGLDLLGFIGAVTAGYGRIFASLRRLRFRRSSGTSTKRASRPCRSFR
jgi:hypothetical protein